MYIIWFYILYGLEDSILGYVDTDINMFWIVINFNLYSYLLFIFIFLHIYVDLWIL